MAVTVQIPALTPVTILPETEHTVGVALAKMIILPDAPPLAANTPVPLATTVGADPKTMLWPIVAWACTVTVTLDTLPEPPELLPVTV